MRAAKRTGNEGIAIAGKGEIFGNSFPSPKGTEAIIFHRTRDRFRLQQCSNLSKDGALTSGQPKSVAMRLHIMEKTALDEIASAVTVEAEPLTKAAFKIGAGFIPLEPRAQNPCVGFTNIRRRPQRHQSPPEPWRTGSYRNLPQEHRHRRPT
ncbi:MAG: hypothetical protein M2R45_00247 [Verrucomicrobia subdivision 3 bacterium]|nr:hypothetical protein [Limisphaerales bacterium]MCS1412994.1 hypothetical protein [Limisphaerales bacterium]